MGCGPSVPSYTGHFEKATDGDFNSNQKTELVYQPGSRDWKYNTFVSKEGVDFKTEDVKIYIQIKGCCVVRIGVTDTDPAANKDELAKIKLFEDEFGTDDDTFSSRVLYRTEFGKIGYHDLKQDTMEFQCYKEAQKAPERLWVYVMIVYGSPKITVKSGEDEHLPMCRLSDGKQVTNNERMNVKTNVTTCCMKEEVKADQVYHIKWDMQLRNEDFAEIRPKYGLCTIGFVRQIDDPKSFRDTSLISFSSAVKHDQFADTVAFQLKRSIVGRSTITSNLLLNSVGQTVTHELPDKFFDGRLYLFIEFSSGCISLQFGQRYNEQRNAGLKLTQDPSVPYLFDNVAGVESMLKLRLKLQDITSIEPHSVLFGPSPVKFVVRFNTITPEKIQRCIDNFGHGACVHNLKETCSVQVHEVPESNDTEYAIRAHFSFENEGGGEIESIERKRKGCWIIVFKDISVARSILANENHCVEKQQVFVLPYYTELGIAVDRKGSYPTFDKTPFDVELKRNDIIRLKYINQSQNEADRFKVAMQKKYNLRVHLPSQTYAERGHFENNTDKSENGQSQNTIELHCEIPEHEYGRLANWKQQAPNQIDAYLQEEIHSETVPVENTYWEDTIEMLTELASTENNFAFMEQSEHMKVLIVSSDKTLLDKLGNDVKTIKYLEKITETLHLERHKYMVLEAEKYIEELGKKYPHTSFGHERLRGPRVEVDAAIDEIQTLAIQIDNITIQITDIQRKVLTSKIGKQTMQGRLEEKQFVQVFEIEKQDLIISVFCTDEKMTKQKKSIVSGCITATVQSKQRQYKEADVQKFHDVKWQKFVDNINLDDIDIRVDPKLRLVVINGTPRSIEQADKNIDYYLIERETSSAEDVASFAKLQFLHKYGNVTDAKCIKDEYGIFTGKVEFTGKPDKIESIRKQFVKQADDILIHWHPFEFAWLASAKNDFLTELPEQECLLRTDIADSLAKNHVKSVAISNKTGAIVMAKVCDITQEIVDIIVSPSDENMSFCRPVSNRIRQVGGRTVLDECKAKQGDKPLSVGQTIMTSPGKLRCLKIIHAVGPVDWQDGQPNDLDKTVANCLELAHKKKTLSIAFPALWTGPQSMAEKVRVFVSAVAKYIIDHKKSSVKEIIFCDKNQKAVDKVVDALNKLDKKDWFVFKHNKRLPNDLQKPVNKAKHSNNSNRNRVNPKETHTEPLKGRPPSAPGMGRVMTGNEDDGSNVESSSEDESHSNGAKDHNAHNLKIGENIRLHVVKGNIADQKADVIVCTTGQFPDLFGPIANAIIEKGGDTIKQECKTHGKIEPGEVRVTTGGTLNCQAVFHVKLKEWDPSTGDNFCRNIITTCMKMAADNEYTSIVFPGIGTGKFDYPVSIVVNAMVTGIQMFSSKNPSSSVKDVSFILFDEQTWTVFERGVPNVITGPGTSNYDTAGVTDTTEEDVSFNNRVEAEYEGPPYPLKRSDVDDVVLVRFIYNKETHLRRAIQATTVKVEQLTREDEIDFHDTAKEGALNLSEIERIEKCSRNGCTVKVDSANSTVALSGLSRHVQACYTKVVSELNGIHFERMEMKILEKVAESVQWYFQKDGQLQAFETDANWKLEEGYNKNTGRSFEYFREEKTYRVEIKGNTFEEYPRNDPSKRRNITRERKDEGDVHVPNAWKIASSGLTYQKVELKPEDKEYNDVKSKFLATHERKTHKKFVNIFRIENCILWNRYQLKKKEVQNRNTHRADNERELWHGTDSETAEIISEKGYNRSFTRKQAYGFGVYFARDVSYSEIDRYSNPDNKGVKRMFLNLVLTGDYEQGVQDMKCLTMKDKANNIPFDSAASDTGPNPRVFVIFHDTQIYPEYLVEFKST